MKLGTQIKFDDGRQATVVYNSLIGVGIMWGLHDPNPEDFEGTDGNTTQDGCDDDFEWEPEALLREPFKGCERHGFKPDECIGMDYQITRIGFGEQLK